MNFQIASLAKSFTTDLTDVRLFTSVNEDVACHSFMMSKCFATDFTHISSLTGVHGKVSSQMILALEALVAMAAFYWPII